MAKKRTSGAGDSSKKNSGANVGYEAELWQMADALPGSMDAAEYKHVVLDLLYISDTFEAKQGVPPAGGMTCIVGDSHSNRYSEPLH